MAECPALRNNASLQCRGNKRLVLNCTLTVHNLILEAGTYKQRKRRGGFIVIALDS